MTKKEKTKSKRKTIKNKYRDKDTLVHTESHKKNLKPYSIHKGLAKLQ